jgi:DNA-binding MarR family transcriptional regulator
MAKSTEFSEKEIARITTYQSGIAQASAHRAMNRLVSDFLLQYGLSAMQWFTLGTIYDSGSGGIRLSDLMRKLDTTLPYITNSVALLESKGLVRKVAHAGDSRIKMVSIEPKHRKQIETIEADLRVHLREVLYTKDRITRDELQNYITVLYKIVEHARP